MGIFKNVKDWLNKNVNYFTSKKPDEKPQVKKISGYKREDGMLDIMDLFPSLDESRLSRIKKVKS